MMSIVKQLLVILLCVSTSISATAQENGFIQHNDTAVVFKLDDVYITDRKWSNDVVQYKYNQMKYYVTTILPYLDKATILFKDIDEKMNDKSLSKRDRRRFVNAKEDEMKEKFEDEIKNLNETQGVLLVKLIGRQTGVNIYSMMNDFKNPIYGLKWLTWARLNGFNLNKRYVPKDDPMLEHIMRSLGYPLPSLYGDQGPIILKESDVYY